MTRCCSEATGWRNRTIQEQFNLIEIIALPKKCQFSFPTYVPGYDNTGWQRWRADNVLTQGNRRMGLSISTSTLASTFSAANSAKALIGRNTQSVKSTAPPTVNQSRSPVSASEAITNLIQNQADLKNAAKQVSDFLQTGTPIQFPPQLISGTSSASTSTVAASSTSSQQSTTAQNLASKSPQAAIKYIIGTTKEIRAQNQAVVASIAAKAASQNQIQGVHLPSNTANISTTSLLGAVVNMLG